MHAPTAGTPGCLHTINSGIACGGSLTPEAALSANLARTWPQRALNHQRAIGHDQT